jgi:hypothetical protein
MLTTSATSTPLVRRAAESDLAAIREIYNQGIADRIATLDEDPKSETVFVSGSPTTMIAMPSLSPSARNES